MKKNKIISLLKKLKKQFGLENWNFDLVFDENNNDESYAEIQTTTNIQYAKITIFRPFFEQTDEEQEQTLIHELLHLKIKEVLKQKDELINSLLRYIRDIGNDEEEKFVNEIATIITKINRGK